MIVNDIPAARHRPYILHNATRGSVELQEQLLEPELRDRRELAIKKMVPPGWYRGTTLNWRVMTHRPLEEVPMWQKRVCVPRC